MPRLDQHIKLADGRKLGFDEYGVEDGKPVFYFHGTPSSRLEWRMLHSAAMLQELHLRLIAPDRPGMGLSSFAKRRRISDWPADVVSLADYIGLKRFAVLGYSGGGPYALACARSIPERLTRVGVASGAGPFDQPGLTDGISSGNLQYFQMVHDKPWLSRQMLRMMGLLARFTGNKVIANVQASLPDADRRAVSRPEIQAGFLDMLREALRPGPRGAQHDTLLMTSPWEFRPQDIRMYVKLWHGEEDRNVPPAMGRYLADLIPDSRIHFYPGEGHISLIIRHIGEFLRYLVE